MPQPWKNTSASLPLSASTCRQDPGQLPSWMASRIPAQPVFSKGSETSDLPPILLFSF